MPTLLSPVAVQQFKDNNGNPLIGGQLFTYVAGTSTPQPSYTDATGTSANTNPVILNSRGEAPIWLTPGQFYKLVLLDASSVLIWSADQVPGGFVDAALVPDTASSNKLRSDLLNTVDVTKSGNLIGYKSPAITAIATTFKAWNDGGITSATAFAGFQGTGTAADTAKLQAAIDNGGAVFLGAGTWLHTGITLNAAVRFFGASQSSTILQCVGTNIDSIKIGNGTNNPNNVTISDMTIQYSTAQTSTCALTVSNGHSIKLERLRFGGGVFNAINLNGGAQQFLYTLRDLEINNPTGAGVQVGVDGTLIQDLWFSDSIIFGAAGPAINLLNVSGFYFKDLDLLTCFNGVRTYPSVNKQVVAGIMHNVLADTCSDWGWNLIDNGGLVSELSLVACWASSCGTASGAGGLLLNSSVGSTKGLQITGGSFTNNKGSGLALLSGSKINLVNVQAFCNSTATSGSQHGIYVAAGVSNWSIVGGSMGFGGLFPTNLQGFGIVVAAGSSDNYQIIGVDVTGNVNGGISDGGTGANKYIYGCIGYRTSGSGSALVASGASSAVIPHGLNSLPLQTDVIISPTIDISLGGVSRYWVSAVTATTFTITTNAAATVNLFFAWQVRTKGA